MSITSHRVAGLLILPAIVALAAGSARAGQIAVSTYDMPNGGSGAHHYWDAGYSNCVASNCITDGAALSGGTGALTDGVIPTEPWFNLTFPGEYIGWFDTSPTIVFNFGSVQTVNEVKLYVDNSHVGGVTAPDALLVDGVSYANPGWAFASPPQLIDITGLSIVSDHITLQLSNPTFWVFASEAQFFNNSAAVDGGGVPEPAAWAMMLLGFGGLGSVMRLRRRLLA